MMDPVPPRDFDEADNMCPNCVTPWKCNGPHLSEEWGEPDAEGVWNPTIIASEPAETGLREDIDAVADFLNDADQFDDSPLWRHWNRIVAALSVPAETGLREALERVETAARALDAMFTFTGEPGSEDETLTIEADERGLMMRFIAAASALRTALAESGKGETE